MTNQPPIRSCIPLGHTTTSPQRIVFGKRQLSTCTWSQDYLKNLSLQIRRTKKVSNFLNKTKSSIVSGVSLFKRIPSCAQTDWVTSLRPHYSKSRTIQHRAQVVRVAHKPSRNPLLRMCPTDRYRTLCHQYTAHLDQVRIEKPHEFQEHPSSCRPRAIQRRAQAVRIISNVHT